MTQMSARGSPAFVTKAMAVGREIEVVVLRHLAERAEVFTVASEPDQVCAGERPARLIDQRAAGGIEDAVPRRSIETNVLGHD